MPALVQYDPDHEYAKKLIQEGHNVFLTAPAGHGKSHVIRAITTPRTLLVAPTGIAALNIGGVTCHRLFGLPMGLPTREDYFKIKAPLRKLFAVKGTVDRIILDEVGTLRPDQLEIIDYKLRVVNNCMDIPFGGIQVIVVGDFYQLEPIVTYTEKDHFYAQYPHAFAFCSKAWNFTTVVLRTNHRQADARQQALLASVRTKDKHSALALKRIIDEALPLEQNVGATTLCCYKEDAKNINELEFKALKGKMKHYVAARIGNIEGWNDPPVGDKVSLKVGCQVIVKSNSKEGTYVNGDRGTVLAMEKDYVIVDINGMAVEVTKAVWQKTSYVASGGELIKIIEGTFLQIPLALGYAVSMHSCQGITMDSAKIHLGKGAFAHGQLYMALSRVRDLRKLSFMSPANITQKSIIVRAEVKQFYEAIATQ